MVADAANVSQRYAKRLLVGIPVDRFARFAAPGRQVVESNHPAFILGHLSLYPANVVRLLGWIPPLFNLATDSRRSSRKMPSAKTMRTALSTHRCKRCPMCSLSRTRLP